MLEMCTHVFKLVSNERGREQGIDVVCSENNEVFLTATACFSPGLRDD